MNNSLLEVKTMAELKDKELNEVVGGGGSVSASGSVDSLRSTYPDEEGFYHDGKETEADWGRN